jgi:hypothetical protein
VNIDADVPLRTRPLLDQLPSDPAAATPEVEHCLVDASWEIGIDERAARVLVGRRVSRSDELAHLEWWQRQLVRHVHVDPEVTPRGARR